MPNKAILQTTIKCLALCVTTSLEPYATCITRFDLQVDKKIQIYFASIDQFSFHD